MEGKQIGDWVVVKLLGVGGMGKVYLVRHHLLGTPGALKILSSFLTSDQQFRDRFLQEAQMQAQLRHPHIAQVIGYIVEGDQCYLFLEYLAGGTLADLIDRTGGPINIVWALTWIRQALAALDYAHQRGVIHRDIKPSNIMLDEHGNAKVVDFGIALVMGGRRLTATGQSIGTPEYMSPEQIVRPKTVDHRTDVYSMGIVLYEMLSGRVPFEGDTDFTIKAAQVNEPPTSLRSLNGAIPAELERMVMRALAKDPDDRYAGCGEFAKALEAFQRGETLVQGATAAGTARLNEPNPRPYEQPITEPQIADPSSSWPREAASISASDPQIDSPVAPEQVAQKARTASSKPYLLAGIIILIITMIGIALIGSFRAAAKREREARQAAELRQMEMDRQMREAEQKAADERKAREAEDLRRQQEQEALKPIGEIDRVWVDHNEDVDGLKGMKIHVKFTMKNYKDIYCTARALFYFSSGNPLKTSAITDYKTADGQIVVEKRFVPQYKESSFEDFEMFLPYKELPLGSGKTNLKFNVQLQTRSGDPIAESEDKKFTFTKPG